MTSSRFVLILILLSVLGAPLCTFGQSQPSGLAVAPGVVYKPPGLPSCYTMYVYGNGSAPVDIRWKFPGGADQIIFNWPQLDGSGQAYICTDSITAVAQHIITGVRRSGAMAWVDVYSVIDVRDTPPQPTSLSFSSSSGYAGNDSYTLHVNVPNITLDLKLTINGVAQPTYCLTLNGNGDWSYALSHYDGQGVYQFMQMKNHNRSDWVNISASYTVKAPKPISATITPSSVVAGQGSYAVTVGNGANINVDLQYTANTGSGEGPLQTRSFWATPVSSGSPDGKATIFVGACETVGTNTYKFVKNSSHDNSTRIGLTNVVVNITAPSPPFISSVSPSVGQPGTTVNVTIAGGNLCGATLSTSYPGISISTSPPPEPATSMNATFTIAPGTQPGLATVVLNATRGTVSFQFSIGSSAAPTVTSITPSACNAGSTVQVTMTGSELFGATLNTSYSGLSFSNVASQGTFLTAQFNIASSATIGTPIIVVTTPGGSTTTAAFSIGSTSCGGGSNGGPASAKEYVYLDGRVVAVEVWSLSTQPPGPPISLTGQALNQNSVELHWYPATPATGTSISGYQVKRAGSVIATLNASQLSFLDTTAAQNTTYSFAAVSRDNAIPQPIVSTNSNSITITTPRSTTPPTAPGITAVNVEWWDECGCFAAGVAWTASTAFNGAHIVGYALLLDGTLVYSGPDTYTEFLTYGGDVLTVYALDDAGNWSGPGH